VLLLESPVYNPAMSKLLAKARPAISMAAIRRYAKRIVERFQPDRIYLFGSHATGTAGRDSDVDLLVVMPARNQLDQAVRIRNEIPAEFPLDLIVRKPSEWQWRLEEGESFSRTIATQGKLLYKKVDKGMGEKGGHRLSTRKGARRRQTTVS
jgi:predicted nucleotidyltransferase